MTDEFMTVQQRAYALGNDLCNAEHPLARDRQFCEEDLEILVRHLEAAERAAFEKGRGMAAKVAESYPMEYISTRDLHNETLRMTAEDIAKHIRALRCPGEGEKTK